MHVCVHLFPKLCRSSRESWSSPGALHSCTCACVCVTPLPCRGSCDDHCQLGIGCLWAFSQGHLRPMIYQIIIFVIIVIINHQSCVVLTLATSVPVVCPHWRAHCWSGPGCCNSSTGHLGRQCYSPITDLVLVWDQSSVLCRFSTRHPCTCWLTSVMSSLSVVSLVTGLWPWLAMPPNLS